MSAVYLTNHAVERLSKRLGINLTEWDRKDICSALTQDAQSWPKVSRANIELTINGQTLYATCMLNDGRWVVVTITSTAMNAPRGKRRKKLYK